METRCYTYILSFCFFNIEDYIKEAENQLGNTNVYEEVPNNAKPLMNIILNMLENIRKRGDICTDTLNYFINS